MQSFKVVVAACAVAATLLSGAPAVLAIPHATAPVTDANRDRLIPAGTLVRIALDQTISSSHNKAGDKFTFKIVDDIKIGDRVAVPAGTQGSGKILSASPAHGGRSDGSLRLEFESLTLADGTKLDMAITRASLTADANEHNGMAGDIATVATMTVPFFYLIDALRKGDDITIGAGRAFHVATITDTFLSQ